MELSLLLALACSTAEPEPVLEAPPPRPDVLVVVLDTVRKDALGAYDADRPVSPTFDRLAARGRLFTDATSSGTWTWPAHASLFTGEPPWVHGAHFTLPAEGAYEERLKFSQPSSELPMLAERFAEAGYATASFSGNPLLSSELGMMRGFQTVEVRKRDAAVVRAASEWLAVEREQPRLVFVNLFGAHAPWEIQPVTWLKDRPELQAETAPAWLAPYLADGQVNLLVYMNGPSGLIRALRGELVVPPEGLELIADLYAGEVMAVDRQLQALMVAWSEAVGPDGIVAVTSDHGEMLGEHGLFEHGRHVRPELVELPLVLSGPGVAMGVEERPVQVEDLHDSLLFLAGLGDAPGLLEPASVPIQARAWPEQIWLSQVGAPFDQGWSYYREGERGVVFGDREGAWCWDGQPLATCEDLLPRAREAFAERAPTEQVEASEETAKQLEALGYVER